ENYERHILHPIFLDFSNEKILLTLLAIHHSPKTSHVGGRNTLSDPLVTLVKLTLMSLQQFQSESQAEDESYQDNHIHPDPLRRDLHFGSVCLPELVVGLLLVPNVLGSLLDAR